MKPLKKKYKYHRDPNSIVTVASHKKRDGST